VTTKQISDSWERGSPYEQYVGRWSRRVAPEFLAWLGVPAGKRWLDVGCGTGALCAAIADACAPSSLAGVEPSEGFLNSARANLAGRAVLSPGNASAVPLADGSVDIVVSGLVLNFIPDLRSALCEMSRVAAAGGIVAGYVWDYAGRMDLMRYFWDTAVELDANALKLDEGIRFPLCNEAALAAAFGDAGLKDIATAAIDIPTEFADFDDYWTPFLGGQGPAPAYAMSLDERARDRLRERIKARVPSRPDGSISLVARAWAIRASVPGRRDA
jgi:SAM-dependent methyltransferase